jgi:hypothetical protein
MSKVTIGFGTSEERDLLVKGFVQSEFEEGRLATILLLEDDSYMLVIENPPGSGRTKQQVMRLTEKSLLALLCVSVLFFSASGTDIYEKISKMIGSEELGYTFSTNLNNEI